MLAILIYVLILWGIIVLAWLVAWWLKRRGAAMSGQFTNIVLFVGFLFGFLLTTLQVFATNHYSEARSQAQSEPTSLVTMYDDLGTFPAHVRATGHRTIICYMWSVAEGDWKAQERGDAQESPATVAWGDRLRNFRNALPQDSPATQEISADLSNADNARQQLLFLAQPQIPAILWAIVFLSSGMLDLLAGQRLSITTKDHQAHHCDGGDRADDRRSRFPRCPRPPVLPHRPDSAQRDDRRHRPARGRPLRATYPARLRPASLRTCGMNELVFWSAG